MCFFFFKEERKKKNEIGATKKEKIEEEKQEIVNDRNGKNRVNQTCNFKQGCRQENEKGIDRTIQLD